MTNIYEFFDHMFSKDPENDKLLSVPGLVDAGIDAYPLLTIKKLTTSTLQLGSMADGKFTLTNHYRYRQKFQNAADDLITKIVGLHNKRVNERRMYTDAVNGVLARRDGEGRALLRGLHKKKKIVRST